MVRRCLSVQLNLTVWQLQECIPVGCVLPTAVAVSWGPVGVYLSACWDTPTPLPPWVWAWRPPGCGPGDPPGMGLDTPLGVGLETPQVWAWIPPWVWAWRPPSQTPQAPPWVWAWKPARHAGIPTLRYHLQDMLR